MPQNTLGWLAMGTKTGTIGDNTLRLVVHIHGEPVGELVLDGDLLARAFLCHIAEAREDPDAEPTPAERLHVGALVEKYVRGLVARLMAGAIDTALTLQVADIQLSDMLGRTTEAADALRQLGRRPVGSLPRADLLLQVPSISRNIYDILTRAKATEIEGIIEALKESAGVKPGPKVRVTRNGLAEALRATQDAIRAYRRGKIGKRGPEHQPIRERLDKAGLLTDNREPRIVAADLLSFEGWGSPSYILKLAKKPEM